MKKISTIVSCKQNRFDFWNSCKHLQNVVNVKPLLATMVLYFGCSKEQTPYLAYLYSAEKGYTM